MKKSEALVKYQSEIIQAMIHYHDAVLHSMGRAQYRLYIWDDGEIEAMEQPQGDHSYLAPRECETRDLFYITTITEGPGFDPWDAAGSAPPEDDAEREAAEAEIIAWLSESYPIYAESELESIIYNTQLMDE